jgi:hypothetical protein
MKHLCVMNETQHCIMMVDNLTQSPPSVVLAAHTVLWQVPPPGTASARCADL